MLPYFRLPRSMDDWREKVVVLTGASSGIGREIARLLGGKGAQLVLVARRVEALEELKVEIGRLGGVPPLAMAADIGDPAQVAALRERVASSWGTVDVLINNAGRGAYGPFDSVALHEFESVVQTNLLGVVYCTRAFLPAMLARGQGQLVFISSIVAELPSPGHSVYSATKFAVSGLAESLDYELAAKGIAILLVEPGLVRTEFAERAGYPQRRFEQMPSKSPGEVAQEIVGAIEKRKRKIIPDRPACLVIKLRQHFPRLARFIFRRVFRRL